MGATDRYRAAGNRTLRRARDMALPRRMGRPRMGETREGIHDPAKERAAEFRRACYWFTTAARLILVERDKARRMDDARDESKDIRPMRECGRVVA